MLRELFIFLVILFVALVAYGVCSQALLFPIRPWRNFILRDIFAYPFWQLFGELYLNEAYAVKAGCVGYRIFASDGTLCPTYHFMVPLLLAIYLVVANILFLNLLIAMFIHVYREAQAHSQALWKYEFFFRVMEYERAAVLPFPFSVFESIFIIFRSCCSCVWKKRRAHNYKIMTMDPLEIELRTFQQTVLRMYLACIRDEEQLSVTGKISSLYQRIEELYRVVEEERLFILQAHGYSREVTVYERPQSAESRPNSSGSDGGRIVGRYSRPKRRGPKSWTTTARDRATLEWETGTTSSLDEAPMLPGYIFEQSAYQAMSSQSYAGEDEMQNGRRRVSLMDERLADLESTTSKSLLGIETLVRGIIEEETQQLSVSSYSSSVDSYSASDEEGKSRVVRRQRYQHRHEDGPKTVVEHRTVRQTRRDPSGELTTVEVTGGTRPVEESEGGQSETAGRESEMEKLVREQQHQRQNQ